MHAPEQPCFRDKQLSSGATQSVCGCQLIGEVSESTSCQHLETLLEAGLGLAGGGGLIPQGAEFGRLAMVRPTHKPGKEAGVMRFLLQRAEQGKVMEHTAAVPTHVMSFPPPTPTCRDPEGRVCAVVHVALAHSSTLTAACSSNLAGMAGGIGTLLQAKRPRQTCRSHRPPTSGDHDLLSPLRRYIDVSVSVLDDPTRVPLGKSKDYINASYIRIVNCGEEYFYIATQGPLLSTIDDFWQMVLENNSNVIAMITREIEGGVIKCYHYWPISLKKPLELKHFCVSLENYQILKYFIIRMFQVVEKSTGNSHSVKQLQFTKWPDDGTPASADSFIKYVRYARKSHLTGPMIVHCSAGIGRTGVFLCADVVFCAIVKNCSEQYHFCYSLVLEVLRKLLTLD
ncbi:tyrosine-protein phosphatase non-receptor type 20 [Aotus nancymaae]|uniref:tyrosine-protein phosphatase non-receptor type 20 n=1 Tax=Aotus nancymaae TaxID=37293 RepID=UPI0030FF3649